MTPLSGPPGPVDVNRLQFRANVCDGLHIGRLNLQETDVRSYEKCYINGEWVTPLSRKEWTLVNPATEEPFATVVLAGAEDVDAAVKAARTAFKSFGKTSKAERIALLERIIDCFVRHEDELSEVVTLELGTPVSQKIHAPAALASFKQALATLKEYEFEYRLGPNTVRREPIGGTASRTIGVNRRLAAAEEPGDGIDRAASSFRRAGDLPALHSRIGDTSDKRCTHRDLAPPAF